MIKLKHCHSTKMKWLVVHVLFFSVAKCLQIADFSKTNIVHDICDFTRHLKTIRNISPLECARVCSKVSDCRRFLYLDSDRECQTFVDGTDCIVAEIGNDCACYRKNKGCNRNQTECTCPLGYYGEDCQHIITDCSDGFDKGMTDNYDLLVNIQPRDAPEPFEVICYLPHGGLTVILYRDSRCLFQNFNRSLAEYEKGFGRVPYNQFLGFDKIMQITANPNLENSFILNMANFITDWSHCQDTYYGFKIRNKTDKYQISMDGYNTAEVGYTKCGDLLSIEGNPFSTYDQDYTGSNECSIRFGGGWWFDFNINCTKSFLTGTMDGSGMDNFLLDDLEGQILRRSVLRIKKESNN